MTQILSREHRSILENTAAKARSEAEAGAEKALKSLAVAAKDAPAHATDAQRELRVRWAICCARTTRKPLNTSLPKSPTSTGTACFSLASWTRAIC
jgi:hypothetical protein